MTGTIVCRNCGEEKPATTEFFHRDKYMRDGLTLHCKPCRTDKAKAWNRRNPERFKANAERWRQNNPKRVREFSRTQALARYGLTIEQYDAMLEAQGGVCAICGAPPGRRSLHVDHDHRCCDYHPQVSHPTCGQCNRGILCTRCNPAMGAFGDDIALLERAIEYLRGASTTQAVGSANVQGVQP